MMVLRQMNLLTDESSDRQWQHLDLIPQGEGQQNTALVTGHQVNCLLQIDCVAL